MIYHPIFQIMSSTNDTNYYCLNATAGESWLSGTVGATATYNRGYDLNSSSDIDALKNAICFLLSRDDLLETFSQNIHYEYKAGVMSWDSIASGLHIIYQEVKGV